MRDCAGAPPVDPEDEAGASARRKPSCGLVVGEARNQASECHVVGSDMILLCGFYSARDERAWPLG